MTSAALPADLREMLDRQAIAETIQRYCRAVDRLDKPLALSVFHPGAEADFSPVYQGDAQGAVDFVFASHARVLRVSHQIGTTIVTFGPDCDTAGSEAAFHSTARFMVDDKLTQLDIWGRYLDRWSKRDGRWAIDRRRTIFDFDETRAVTGSMGSPDTARDRTDPSHAVLGDLLR